MLARAAMAVLLAAASAGCEGSAGGYTHATAPGRVESAITSRVGDGARVTDTVAGARPQECRGGLVALSIGPGTRGTSGQPRLSTLYLKAPAAPAPGRYPLRWADGRWQTPWALDGTLTPDPSRSMAPFAMEDGTVDGTVTIERAAVDGDGNREVAGSLAARVAGDARHRLTV